jgi:flagellar protein FlaG
MVTEVSSVTTTMATTPARENDSQESAQTNPVVHSTATKKPNKDQIDGMVHDLNKSMQEIGTHVSFSVDTETNRTIIKVIDTTTKEVVRQIPPENMLRVSENITKLLGLMVDQAA